MRSARHVVVDSRTTELRLLVRTVWGRPRNTQPPLWIGQHEVGGVIDRGIHRLHHPVRVWVSVGATGPI